MTILIIDDEHLARQINIEYINELNKTYTYFEAENTEIATSILATEKIDLILLDIEMPGENGINWLSSNSIQIPIIFTTAYDEFAIKAFELHALDYLLKPFSFQRFKDAMKRVENNFSIDKIHALLSSFQKKTQYLEKLMLKDKNNLIFLKTLDIIAIEAMADYCKIHIKDTYYIDLKTLTWFEEQLNPELFVRIHRSTIINTNYLEQISSLDDHSTLAKMSNNKTFEISKSGLKKIKL